MGLPHEAFYCINIIFRIEIEANAVQTGSPGNVVKTGDENNLLPYYIAMGLSGVLVLLLAADGVRRRKKEGGSK